MAEGICDVANSKMAQAIRTITVSRGIEPRDSALVAFGGAGPMHAVFLARELGISETIVPRFPGAFSAWGMLQTRVRRDFSQPYFRLDADLNGAEMAAALAHMRDNGLDVLSEEGVKPEQRSVSHSVDIRYEAQEYTLTVPLNGADEPKDENFLATVAERFADMHRGPLRSRQSRRADRVRDPTSRGVRRLRTTAAADLARRRHSGFPPRDPQGGVRRRTRRLTAGPPRRSGRRAHVSPDPR